MSSKTTFGIVVIAVVLLGLPLALKMKRDYANAANTYRLVTADGHELPFAPRRRNMQSPEIVSSTLNMYNNGTFHATMSYRSPSGAVTNSDFKGTYTGTDPDFTLKWEGAGECSVKIDGSKLTLTNQGIVFVYKN